MSYKSLQAMNYYSFFVLQNSHNFRCEQKHNTLMKGVIKPTVSREANSDIIGAFQFTFRAIWIQKVKGVL